MRYINVIRALGQPVVTPIGDSQCITDLQRELYGRGNFPKSSITGTWNVDTYKWLDNIYGDRNTWWNFGGACEIRNNLKSSSGSLAFKTPVVTGAEPIVINAKIPKSNTPSYGPTATPEPQPGPYTFAPASTPNTIFGLPAEYVLFGSLAAAFLLLMNKRSAPTFQPAR